MVTVHRGNQSEVIGHATPACRPVRSDREGVRCWFHVGESSGATHPLTCRCPPDTDGPGGPLHLDSVRSSVAVRCQRRVPTTRRTIRRCKRTEPGVSGHVCDGLDGVRRNANRSGRPIRGTSVSHINEETMPRIVAAAAGLPAILPGLVDQLCEDVPGPECLLVTDHGEVAGAGEQRVQH